MSPSKDTPSSPDDSSQISDTGSLLTRAGIATVELTPTGEIMAVNDAFATHTGYSLEELRGYPFSSILSTVSPPLESALSGDPIERESMTAPLFVEPADGDAIRFESYFEAISDADADDPRIVGVLHRRSSSSTWTDEARDLDSQPSTDEGSVSAKTFVALANALSDGIIVLNTESQIQYANPAVERILGYTPDELVGGSKLSIIPERLRETHLTALNRYLETGTKNIDWEYVELPGQHKDGHEIPLGISLNDFFFEGDRYFVGLFRDISERKEIQRKLEESNERLEQFAYAASHDLQEPLRMITSYLQLIEQRYGDEFDEDGREFLTFAVDGADRMREMIDGLLQYSRVDTQGDPLQPVDLNAVVDDVLSDLQLKIEEEAAELDVEELPRVSGDSGQLRQVFQNLLSNAIEYSGDEPPRIRIGAERSGEMWRISVHDDGIGIDPDETDRIFQVFQRLHASSEHGGTGIGLALCERIVERHGGRIWVESSPGEGSTFNVTLPRASG